MSEFSTGSFPDSVLPPAGDERGTVVVLAGIGESRHDFGFLVDELVLAGYRVVAFDDVSFDTESSRVGAIRALRESSSRPVVLLGSDVGATLAADIASANRTVVSALVLVGIVSAASKADDELDPLRPEADDALPTLRVYGRRLPSGVALPAPVTVGVPTLVFHGNSDPVTDIADAVSWAAQLPLGSMRVIQRGDHHLLSGDSHRTVAASVLLFVERHRAGEPVVSDGLTAAAERRA